MKSKVTKPYDYKQAEIPAELRLWRVRDEEIQEKLETLSHNHAYETEPETVEKFDSVACRGESAVARWNRSSLRFYPGRGLCDAAIENALLGAKVGERRTVATDEGEIALTVTRIVRRAHYPIGDELVKLEHIDGVNTVADYCDWYRKQNEPERRALAPKRMAYYLTQEVKEKSEFSFDEEEKRAFVTDCVDRIYDSMVQAGIDPTIPKEGFDFLTEEQAKEKMYGEQEWAFTAFVVHTYIVEQVFGLNMEDVCQEGLEKLAAENGTTPDALRATSCDAMIQGNFAHEKAIELLGSYAEQFLED